MLKTEAFGNMGDIYLAQSGVVRTCVFACVRVCVCRNSKKEIEPKTTWNKGAQRKKKSRGERRRAKKNKGEQRRAKERRN